MNGPAASKSVSLRHMWSTAATPRSSSAKSAASSTSWPKVSRSARTRRNVPARISSVTSPSPALR